MALAPTSDSAFQQLARAFEADPAVTLGSMSKKGFGRNALYVREKIFAMLTPDGRLVLKLPAATVSTLIASGHGTAFQMSSRTMKEWITLHPAKPSSVLTLARQAKAFVENS
jgi:hypothetical protein